MQNSTEPGLNVCLINLATFYNNKYRAKIARDREDFSANCNNLIKVTGCMFVFESVCVYSKNGNTHIKFKIWKSCLSLFLSLIMVSPSPIELLCTPLVINKRFCRTFGLI